MEELAHKIKELRDSSLYRFIDIYNDNFDFMILYFSPDDYHSYIGFKSQLDKNKLRKVVCSIGNFYINTKNYNLFIDSPFQTVEASEQFYHNIYKEHKYLAQFKYADVFELYPFTSFSNVEN